MSTKRKTRSIELTPKEVHLARSCDLKRIDRRVEPQPEKSSEGLRWGHWMYGDMLRLCPYGRAGDRVRFTEEWASQGYLNGNAKVGDPDAVSVRYFYGADYILKPELEWRSGDSMPKEASRFEATISEVDVDYCLINDCGCWGWIIRL